MDGRIEAVDGRGSTATLRPPASMAAAWARHRSRWRGHSPRSPRARQLVADLRRCPPVAARAPGPHHGHRGRLPGRRVTGHPQHRRARVEVGQRRRVVGIEGGDGACPAAAAPSARRPSAADRERARGGSGRRVRRRTSSGSSAAVRSTSPPCHAAFRLPAWDRRRAIATGPMPPSCAVTIQYGRPRRDRAGRARAWSSCRGGLRVPGRAGRPSPRHRRAVAQRLLDVSGRTRLASRSAIDRASHAARWARRGDRRSARPRVVSSAAHRPEAELLRQRRAEGRVRRPLPNVLALPGGLHPRRDGRAALDVIAGEEPTRLLEDHPQVDPIAERSRQPAEVALGRGRIAVAARPRTRPPAGTRVEGDQEHEAGRQPQRTLDPRDRDLTRLGAGAARRARRSGTGAARRG